MSQSGPSRRAAFLDQPAQQVDAERGVGGLQHRDLARRRLDRAMMIGGEAGRADHDRRAGGDGRVEMGLERVGRGEIDQHVACRRQRLGGGMIAMDEAVAVDAAGDGRARFRRGVADRLAHPPAHAQYADRSHCRFMGERAAHRKPFARRNSVRARRVCRAGKSQQERHMAEREREVIVTNGGGGGGSGAIIAVVLLIAVLVGLYLVFGTHLLRGAGTNVNINVNTPATN